MLHELKKLIYYYFYYYYMQPLKAAGKQRHACKFRLAAVKQIYFVCHGIKSCQFLLNHELIGVGTVGAGGAPSSFEKLLL